MFNLGDKVQCHPDKCGKNALDKYGDKIGTVVQINNERFRNGEQPKDWNLDQPFHTEIGVTFGFAAPRNDGSGTWAKGGGSTLVWFDPSELNKVATD